MKDREAFELQAINFGETILRSEKTILMVESIDQRMMTTYVFTEDGKLKKFLTTWY